MLKNKLHINKLRLDEELQEIAELLEEYGELHASEVKKRDKQKLKIEVLEAQLTSDLAKDWDKHGFAKAPTGDQTKAFIKINEEYQRESEKLIDISAQVGYYNATLTAVQAKRSALGNMVQLFLTGYWAGMPLTEERNVLEEGMSRRRRGN